MSQHDTDLATMSRDQLVATIIELRAAVRTKHYCSDVRDLLPEARAPKEPWSDLRLDDEDDD